MFSYNWNPIVSQMTHASKREKWAPWWAGQEKRNEKNPQLWDWEISPTLLCPTVPVPGSIFRLWRQSFKNENELMQTKILWRPSMEIWYHGTPHKGLQAESPLCQPVMKKQMKI